MSPRPAIDLLPEDIKKLLRMRLAASQYARIMENTDWLNGVLAEHGLQVRISKSALGRHAVALRERSERIADRVALTTAIADEVEALAPDDEARTSRMALRLADARLLEILEAAESDDVDRIVKVVRGITASARAHPYLGRYQHEVKDRLQAAAEQAEAVARQGGLSAEYTGRLRDIILHAAA